MSSDPATATPLFHICTLVTRPQQYRDAVASMRAAGFVEPACIYEAFDNSGGNRYEPYSLINTLLAAKKAPYLILCHQDILFDRGHGFGQLVGEIRRVEALDPRWAVLGSTGNTDDFQYVLMVHDPYNVPLWQGPLPLPVHALDEDFLVFNTASPVRASESLSGFHMYGTDVCIAARVAGSSAWVVNFEFTHLSKGNRDDSFHAARKALMDRWSPHFRGIYICRGSMFLSRWAPLRKLAMRRRVVAAVLKTPLLKKWASSATTRALTRRPQLPNCT